MSGHAVLSASSAHRWLYCTPSARLEEQFPDSAGEAAAEGSLAHAIAELKLRKYFGLMGPAAFTRMMNKLKKDEKYEEVMQTHTDVYVDLIRETAAPEGSMVFIEKKLDLSKYVPQGFGTADCIVLHGTDAHVFDFKYGQGVPVHAEENPQMMLYALGALYTYSAVFPVRNIKMTIVQPRLNNIGTWEIEAEDLLTWANDFLIPRAQMAWDGAGAFNPGDAQCRFCRANAQCRARAEENEKIAKYEFKKGPLLENWEIADILGRIDELVKWANSIKEYALTAVLSGENIPGWKAVEGRSNRAFTDTDAAFEMLISTGVSKDILYERKPITLTAVEKLLGKKAFDELCGPYVDKPKGKPTLAPETDKRPPYSTAKNDFKEEI